MLFRRPDVMSAPAPDRRLRHMSAPYMCTHVSTLHVYTCHHLTCVHMSAPTFVTHVGSELGLRGRQGDSLVNLDPTFQTRRSQPGLTRSQH